MDFICKYHQNSHCFAPRCRWMTQTTSSIKFKCLFRPCFHMLGCYNNTQSQDLFDMLIDLCLTPTKGYIDTVCTLLRLYTFTQWGSVKRTYWQIRNLSMDHPPGWLYWFRLRSAVSRPMIGPNMWVNNIENRPHVLPIFAYWRHYPILMIIPACERE